MNESLSNKSHYLRHWFVCLWPGSYWQNRSRPPAIMTNTK